MTRNLKVLGLAIAAVFAMSAVAASSASAETAFHFTGPSGTTTLAGVDDPGTTDVFTTDSGTVSCLKASYSGSITGPTSNSVTVTPSYSECHVIFFFTFKVTVDVNGCQYRFNAVTKTGSNYEGSVDILCSGSNKIVVTAPGCEVTVPPQTGLNTVTYTQVGSGATQEITVDANLSGITYTEDDDGLCENDGVLTHNGTYVGKGTVTGSQGGNHVAIGLGDT